LIFGDDGNSDDWGDGVFHVSNSSTIL
jgi:hypothetical protein